MRKRLVIAVLAGSAFIFSLIAEGCHEAGKKRAAQPGNTGFVFKDKLSEYGFFEQKLQAALFHYELATPLFTDYAVKDRFILLPKGTHATYTGAGLPNFPDSTIIIKNFAYNNEQHQKIMIETRMLVKDPSDHAWKVMNYLWNKEQTDAVKHITGAKVPITLLDDDGNKISTVYQVPNTNDCKRCHTSSGVIMPIGPKIRNLNTMVKGGIENQLEKWAAIRGITGLPDLKTVAALPNWKDSEHFTVEQRARAYIDVNCAHCHNAKGDASNTGLYVEYEQTDANQLGILKEPVSAGGGAGGLNYDIIPGDAAHSIFAYRMISADPGTAMPELARTVVHKEGVQLIVDWINQMKTVKANSRH